MSKGFVGICGLIFLALLCPASSRSLFNSVFDLLFSSTTSEYRGTEDYLSAAPALTADEWNERLAIASRDYQHNLDHLFAELPTQENWPAILETLDNTSQESKYAEEIEIFLALLKGDQVSALDLYLKTVSSKPLSDYQYRKVAKNIRLLGGSDLTIQETLKRRKPKKSEEEPKDDWKQLLAEGEIESALTIVRDETSLDHWKVVYRIGILYERQELIDEAIKAMGTEIAKKLNDDDQHLSAYDVRRYFNALLGQQNYTAITEVFSEIENSNKLSYAQDIIIPAYFLARKNLEPELPISELLSELPEYEIETQGQLLEFLTQDENSIKFADLVISSLQDLGKEEDALGLLKHLLAIDGGQDSFYQILLSKFPGHLSYLDDLLAWNPYEERPLIWKSKHLLAQGKIAEAEASIRRAIELDPSDGDQGKLTRMEAYQVLSEIHQRKGNQEKAVFFADVMRAIRAGEAADDFLYAGLISEAIKRYREALGHFESAYCLQSRLAKTLLEQGDLKGATKHFEKAFELMPVSFGPVESHCFGCEGIFKTPEAQAIAERVFKGFIDQFPNNPRAYYLFGLLYEKQNKPEKALPLYLKAFQKDPHYYNCAKKLYAQTLIDEQINREHPNLQAQLMRSYPYAELDRLFRLRVDLKSSWLQAQTVAAARENPLKLPELRLSFLKKREDVVELDLEYPALDGWEAHELLRKNDFLEDLE